MARRNTLLVVGAGASAEAGLPIGRGLADQISKILRFEADRFGSAIGGDEDFRYQLERHTQQDFKSFAKTAQTMSPGILRAPSIDQFIDRHSDDERVAILGKAAVIQTILKAERNSTLYADESKRKSIGSVGVRATWYAAFADLICADTNKSKLDEVFCNVTVVCFNYDRCIEQFLAFHLSELYRIPLAEARARVAGLSILRPYGLVAPLYGANAIFFGSDFRNHDIFYLANNIRTFTQQEQDHTVVARIRKAIEEADTIAFLGFYYLQQNMKLLSPEKPTRATRIYGTAFERSGHDVIEIKNRIRGYLYNKGPNHKSAPELMIDQTKCGALLRDHSLGLDLTS